MSASKLRIFSYLPNPRVWKSVFAARLGGIEIDVIGDKPPALSGWLWDLNPRQLGEEERDPTGPHARTSKRGFSTTLYKTDAFLVAHPFGTVPAAFAPGTDLGIFESNSILRATARASAHPTLYGRDGYEASRIDSFLDADLVFGREAQVYLLDLTSSRDPSASHQRMAGAYDFFLSGIESALGASPFLTGDTLTLADIAFACDLAQFLREGHYTAHLTSFDLDLISRDLSSAFPRVLGHLRALTELPEFHELKRYLRWYYAVLEEAGSSAEASR